MVNGSKLAPMSETGQKRRFGDVRATSALPPKTDIHREGRHVSKVPRSGHGPASSPSPVCAAMVTSEKPQMPAPENEDSDSVAGPCKQHAAYRPFNPSRPILP